LFLTLFTIVVVAEPLARTVAHDRIASRTDTRELAREWLAFHAMPGSRVAVVGTKFWSYGEPVIPAGLEMVRSEPDAALLEALGARYVVTHDHVLFSSRVDPAALERLSPRLRLLAEFDPFRAPRDEAVFELSDAYYIPMAGFSAVSRPGPVIRIYEFE
jgi:hypothetical protein